MEGTIYGQPINMKTIPLKRSYWWIWLFHEWLHSLRQWTTASWPTANTTLLCTPCMGLPSQQGCVFVLVPEDCSLAFLFTGERTVTSTSSCCERKQCWRSRVKFPLYKSLRGNLGLGWGRGTFLTFPRERPCGIKCRPLEFEPRWWENGRRLVILKQTFWADFPYIKFGRGLWWETEKAYTEFITTF